MTIAIQSLIRQALREDLGKAGDVTTRLFTPSRTRMRGNIVAKQPGVICGTKIAAKVFRHVDRDCRVRVVVQDGRRVKPGQTVMVVSGGRSILTAERTALNFLQRLSGVATLTAAYADKVKGTRAKIFDTRKTLPGWRALDKYAVKCGGGRNHRMGLYDAVLVKDNHWASGVDILKRVNTARSRHPGITIELEAASLDQVHRALACRPDIILLDNMRPAPLRRAIALIRRQAPQTEIEISGGVSLGNIRSLARLGPDRISVGRLTHSAPALDLSLEIS